MFGLAIGVLLAAVAAPSTPAPTMQALFDAASAATDDGHCAEAVRDFGTLEDRSQVRRNAAVLAMIRLRKGRCLATLGRADEAAQALRDGLAGVSVTNEYRNDIAQAHIALGRIAYARFDYPDATREFLAARDLLSSNDRFEALIWLVRATMFDPGTDPRVYADEALALAKGLGVSKAVVADVKTLHARVLLNHNAQAAAYVELKQALDAEGGLTLKVNAAMIGTRSDLALAALLNHDEDNARRYLAYTGAGRGTPFGSAAVMAPPPCDGDALRPDDSAIVEFGIAADGSVGYAVPIYASRLGPIAATFARAVADWSWQPEALKNIAPLFRAVTRVELRCSTASARPHVAAGLNRDLDAWLASRGIIPIDTGPRDAASVATLRAELARRRAISPDGIAAIPALMALGGNEVLSHAERRTAFDEAHAIATRGGAPVGATTLLAIAGGGEIEPGRTEVATYREMLRRLLATPAVAADPRSRSIVRLLLVEASYRSPPPPDAATLLRAVADDPALPAHDPLRSNARVRLASLLAQSGDLAAARATYELSGVKAEQCALVDARPVLSRAGVSERDFPHEALRWGFEGWVRLEFDVAADGHIAGQRAIIAYPPRVFGPAAVVASRAWRYEQSFRPDGEAGCGGAQQQIKFTIAAR
jgi:tetratricopeptide (TPR) repeat protein